MNSIMPIAEAFSQVYLVDFSPSLCEVARERVKRMGWTNVSVVCEDARQFRPQETDAEVITMSYSLSMIPDYYSVVDSLANLLSPEGIIGACDFYVQSIVDVSSRTYTGGTFNRHVNWLGRLFWRAWFDADRVNLDGGRRDYLEYKFGTVLSASDRNYLLGGIPYYIFLGCPTEVSSPVGRTQDMVDKLDAALTESPYLSPKDYQRALSEAADDTSLIRSKAYESAIVNLTAKLPLPSTFYQNHHWRIYYNDLLQKHLQFNGEYIYAFNWEDPKVDRQLLNINKDDVILTITSAGDNVLDYLLESPRRIHAVDLNPNQNHLLELKIAAFTALPREDVWSLFGTGHQPDFRSLLIQKLSPHLSSPAFQFWLTNTRNLTSPTGLYSTGGSRHAIKLIRTLFASYPVFFSGKTACPLQLASWAGGWVPGYLPLPSKSRCHPGVHLTSSPCFESYLIFQGPC
jgi:betaine lipid synthase